MGKYVVDKIVSWYPLEKLYPHKDYVVVHTFSTKSTVEDVQKIHSEIVQAFPDNPVISIPDTDSIACLDKQSTIEFLQAMILSLQPEELV